MLNRSVECLKGCLRFVLQAELDAADCAALLSAFVAKERCKKDPAMSPDLIEAKKRLLEIAAQVAKVQEDAQLGEPADEHVDGLRFGMLEVLAPCQ